MGYKISQINIDRFRDADPELANFSNLDTRLGIEQIIYDLPFRTEATAYWGGAQSSIEQIISDDTADRWRATSPRHQVASRSAVRAGIAAIIDDPDFQDSCMQRWALQDAQPPTEGG